MLSNLGLKWIFLWLFLTKMCFFIDQTFQLPYKAFFAMSDNTPIIAQPVKEIWPRPGMTNGRNISNFSKILLNFDILLVSLRKHDHNWPSHLILGHNSEYFFIYQAVKCRGTGRIISKSAPFWLIEHESWAY